MRTVIRRGGEFCCSFVANLLQCLCAKNYQNTMWLDKVIAEIRRVQFFFNFFLPRVELTYNNLGICYAAVLLADWKNAVHFVIQLSRKLSTVTMHLLFYSIRRCVILLRKQPRRLRLKTHRHQCMLSLLNVSVPIYTLYWAWVPLESLSGIDTHSTLLWLAFVHFNVIYWFL